MKKSTRKIKAQETLNIIEQGFYLDTNNNKITINKEIEKAVNNTRYFTSKELDDLKKTINFKTNTKTEFTVIQEDSISSILRLSKKGENKIMCLNFASAKNPGGCFLNGALAQEESLAISSALYASQMKAFEFYTTHRNMKSCIYTDSMIHSPNIPVFRDRNGNLIQNYATCGFITSAAVNKGVIKLKEQHLLSSISNIMDLRIEKLLSICAKENYETLILGAWGCGVFQNDPKTIATLFYKHLNGKFKNHFKHVVFAIYSKNEKFINAFNNVFDKEIVKS
ncbi:MULTISPECIES: TIGR02452 family protein [unclassified Tenacibaculum]|uniref:TIGR02452 family protein n=1 Tax=unclassified Tenacibaculum TaxID=2635139 RepID=UPI001F1689D7|nr:MULTISPECIES: TIGR02452 family protein [unclassified Tenacibaculum]MCF2873482.1 TIGR02452 family protein [Tenacibaculum sp. Cn5-1]MCF2933638.1 TIGR02452 family protein [Tenacibaculum sp. Cn5-34]MCG7509780.1 TIGR02452 family protein [Tenacibaculum sp. Cn5-46]